MIEPNFCRRFGNDSEKNASEPEVIHLEDDEEMQNQSILRLNQNSERETNVLKESNAKPSLEVTSEASFDALETFQESNASNLIGNKCKSNDIPSKDTEVLQKRIDQVRQRLDDHLSVQVNGEECTIEFLINFYSPYFISPMRISVFATGAWGHG